jgi:hypothetical protein
MWFASGELAYAAEVDTEPLVAVSLTARIRLLRAKLGISQQKVLRMLSAFAEPASLPDVAAVLNMSMKEVTGPVRVLVSGR